MASPTGETGAASQAALPSESFATLLSKEIERSRRYYRGFGLLRVRWPEAPRRAPGRSPGTSSLPSSASPPAPGPNLVAALARTLRRADLVAAAPEGGLYILLPETPASGVPAVSRRLEEALAHAAEAGPEAPARISQAAYPRDGDSPGELLGALANATS